TLPHRIRIRAWRRVAVLRRLGRTPRLHYGPLRIDHRNRPVWPIGQASHGTGAVPIGRPRVLGRRQWIVASRRGLDQSPGQELSDRNLGSYAGPCELVESSGDLFFQDPTQGSHTQRFRQLGGSRATIAPVRRTNQQQSAPIQLEVRPNETDPVSRPCKPETRSVETWSLIVKQTTYASRQG